MRNEPGCPVAKGRNATLHRPYGPSSARRDDGRAASPIERAKDLLRAEFYAWCCSSCARGVWKTISVSGAQHERALNFDFTQARKYVKPRPDPKELCFATDDDEPLSPMKRTRLSF